MHLSYTTKKAVALFFLGETLLNIGAPIASYALTSGPNQTEYTSYEPSDTTDMVDLLTGDFTYNVPLLDVPSPEGGFSLPLSYHSGIKLEDEASWAGLGWNVNAGSISRSKVSGADDDFDNISNVNVQDPGGSGYIKNYVVYQKSWDSEKGYGGAINLLNVASQGWSDKSGLGPTTVMGLSYSDRKAHFDPAQAFAGITTVATFGAAAPASAAVSAVKTGMDVLQTAHGLYSGYKSQGTTYGFNGGWSTSKTSSNWGFRTDYKYWLDNTREEHSYGALYLGQMQNNTSVNPSTSVDDIIIPRVGTPQQNTQATRFPQAVNNDNGTPAIISDMFTYVEPGTVWAHSFNPTHVAYDSYAVMGPGIGGRIAPYRPEVGSLVFPKKLNNGSYNINLIPYLEEGPGKGIDKVQFKYDGEPSNAYGHHDSNGPGVSIAHAGTDYNSERVYYNLTDPKIANASSRTEANREGLYNKRLAQGKHVAWFSNAEMATDAPSKSGQIMEYKPLADNNRRAYRSTWPEHGIGGYAITNVDGTTYHYALPVYNKKQEDFTGVTGKENAKFSRITSNDWYATTWLLTAITGPDFVDRGAIGSVDTEDYGYWVKFDYGRFANDYAWRTPYVGYTQNDGYSSYGKGVRETYYLNSIQTRSHTALFLKDVRQDGRGAYRLTSTGAVPAGTDPTDNKYPASSLALREIVLFNNADFQALQDLGFAKSSATGARIDQAQLQAPASAQQQSTCSLQDVYDEYDVQDNPAFRTFIDQKAQRKILLNASYELCPSTINSFASASNPPVLDGTDYTNARAGKLTLKSLSYYGPGNNKLFPDFKFQYNSANPLYDVNAWDGWGSYNSGGSYSHYSYGSDPTAWHLTDIITPLGGRMRVSYESDDYSSISGEPIRQQVPISGFRATDETHGVLSFDLKNIAPNYLGQFLANGSTVTLQKLEAKQTRQCWAVNGRLDPETYAYDIPATQQVQNLGYDSFTIQRPATDGGHGNAITGCPQATWSGVTGALELVLPSKLGGGVRVAAISVRDEVNNEYKTGYLYTQTGEIGAPSSGVVAQEPELVRTADYPFYHYYDYPSTPVLYSKVTVVDGLRGDTDYKKKTQYTFNTPTKNCVQLTSTSTVDDLNWSGYYGSTIRNSKLFYFDIKNFTAQVGRLESIKVVDNQGFTAGETKFNYTSQLPGNQGKFTAGSSLCEVASGNNPGDDWFFKLSRTAITTYPNVLASVQTTSNGVRSQKDNIAWDFLTGAVLKSTTTTSQGEVYASTVVPAYVRYPELRAKAEQATNKQMLSQSTATYTHKLNGNGVATDLVSADVQTWKKDWQNYRVFDASARRYSDEAGTAGVWRHHKNYSWNDPHLSNTGTTPIGKFTDFTWANASTQHKQWQELQEATLYDHFSAPVEVKTNGTQYMSRKRGYGNALTLMDAPNARYGECAYSGAEDLVSVPGATHFGGEVSGGEYRSGDVAHTGLYSLKLPANSKGFVFETPISTANGVVAERAYQASVWIHQSALETTGGHLFANLKNSNGTRTLIKSVAITDPSAKRAGSWYLLNLHFTVPANTGGGGQTIEVGCSNDDYGVVYFDDFRFHPLVSLPTTYVYDPGTWQQTYVLNADNLYTRFEYDNTGRLFKTYREVLNKPQADVLVKESRFNYARNTVYSITANNPGNSGTLSPSGSSAVYLGDDISIKATGSSCNFFPGNEFKVDGKNYFYQAILSDGTTVNYDGNRGYTVSNVHGNHTLDIAFSSANYTPAGTWYRGGCVADRNGCYTGMVTWYLADGCGGHSQTEERPADRGECVNQTPCNQVAE